MSERIVGVDVGGTFTDLVLYDPEARSVRIAKVLSTSRDRTESIMRALGQAGADIQSLAAIVHGTTVATNSILERRGARCGLVTTAGFRDVLELRRRDRPHTYGLTGGFEPLIPRELRVEVTERIAPSGQVITALDSESVRAAVATLEAARAEAVAVCLFNSHVNPDHERALAAALREALPGVPVSVSSEIVPEIGEFERASTVAANAFLQPLIGRYLGGLEGRLRDAGYEREVLVLQSSGGVMTSTRAREVAVRTALSGPAAGVIAAMRIGERAGRRNVISCDMGGTSFDVALVHDGRPTLSTEKAIEFGIPLKVPMIDIHTIGAGGGSIAWVDRGGTLRVGPQSAGSDPGPAAYRRGGEAPTVTDANLVLGRLDPDRSLGTEEDFTLDEEAARAAVERVVAGQLGLGLEEAAAAIIEVANQRMAAAIRMVSVNRGHDPREFALVGFGGAGPLHAVDLARWVGCRTVVIPTRPGITSALGCVGADLQVDYVRSVGTSLDEIDATDVAESLEEHASAGTRFLEEEGVALEHVVVSHRAGMAYAKQLHSVTVALDGESSTWNAERLRAAFLDAYGASYGVAVKDAAVKLVDLRTTVIGKRLHTELDEVAVDGASSDGGALAHRDVYLDGEWRSTAVHAREALHNGAKLAGPALIEQPDTTSLLPPGAQARIDRSGNIVVAVTP